MEKEIQGKFEKNCTGILYQVDLKKKLKLIIEESENLKKRKEERKFTK